MNEMTAAAMASKDTQQPPTTQLIERLVELGRNERQASLERRASSVLGPSVVRVFRKGTKRDIRPVLASLPVAQLERCRDQATFDLLFFSWLNRVDRAILKRNQSNSRIMPGHLWGHAAKILCLFSEA
jgi:hypothetical protein